MPAPLGRRRMPSSRIAAHVDRARIEELLRPLVPDEHDREFVVRCLLDEGPAHHRGANYALVALLGEVARRVGAVPRPPDRPHPVPMRVPPHLAAEEEEEYPLGLDLAPLRRLGLDDAEALDAVVDCLTDGPPQHVVANVVMVNLIGAVLAALEAART